MDNNHEGRWKLKDPDIFCEGESCTYSESSTDTSVADDVDDDNYTGGAQGGSSVR